MKLPLILSAHLLVASAAFQPPQPQTRRLDSLLRAKRDMLAKDYNVLTPKRPNYSKVFPSDLEAPAGKLPPVQSSPAVVDPTPPVPEPVVMITEPPPSLPSPVIEIPAPEPVIAEAPKFEIPKFEVPEITLPTPSTMDVQESTGRFIDQIRENQDNFITQLRESTPTSGDASTLSEYIRQSVQGSVDGEIIAERLSKLKSLTVNVDALQDLKFDTTGWVNLQQNLNMAPLQQIPADKLRASFDGALQVLVSRGLSKETLQQMWEALNTKELGGWYAGVITVIVLFIVAATGPDEELTPVVEGPPISAAEATPAVAAKTDQGMEMQVLQLSEATAAVSKELKELKMRLAERDYTVASMQSEFRLVQNEVSSLRTVERQLQSKITSLENELAVKSSELVDETARHDMIEAGLRARIESMESKEKVPKSSVVEVAPTTAPTPAPKPAPVEEPIAKAAPAPKPAPKVVPAAEPVTNAAPSVSMPAPKSAAAPEAPAAARSPAFFATKEKPASSPNVTMKPASASLSSEDWSGFAASTLLRKTVSELSDYLVAKVCKNVDS